MRPAEAEGRLGIKAYARRAGVSPPAVRRAIDDGRLKKSIEFDKRGRASIDPRLADREWARNTNTRKSRRASAKGSGAEVRPVVPAAAPKLKPAKPGRLSASSPSSEGAKEEHRGRGRKMDAAPAAELESGPGVDWGNSSPPGPASPPVRRRRGRPPGDQEDEEGEQPEDLAEALRRKEVALADLNELKVAEKEKSLVDAVELELRFFGLGRTVRERLLSIAPRLGPELCPADPNHGELRIRQEITEALEELGDERHPG